MGLLLDVAYSLTLLPHYGYHRCFTGKYGPDAPEKLGCLSDALAPSQESLWVHAVSVGEANTTRPLVDHCREAFPELALRISTTTATGREVASKQYGAQKVFYYPLDCSWMVRRAFDRIKPKAIVLMELEVWPHFLLEAKRRDIPVIVSNVRITERSVRRFKKAGKFAKPMLDAVSLWLSQDENYAAALRDIGVDPKKIQVVGSLKYDLVPTTLDDGIRNQFRQLLNVDDETPVVIAGSTHRGEDEIVLQAYEEARRVVPSLRLVLAPRHPERIKEVKALAGTKGSVALRSTLENQSNADIVVLDTMGELSKLYAAADVVVMGGTFLAAVGGHNMMEPCGLGRATIMGPHVHNFVEPSALLLDAKGIRQIDCGSILGATLIDCLENRGEATAMGERGRASILACQGVAARSVELITPCLQANG